MPIDFHKDMEKYLTDKRRKRLFSGIKAKAMNKKSMLSNKAITAFGEIKGKVSSKVEEIKKKREEVKKEITQEDINGLVEKQSIKKSEEIELMPKEEDGWKEVKLEHLEKKKPYITGLEGIKKKIQEDLAKIHEKEEYETEKLVKLSEEKEQREKAESEEDKIKRLELEEEIKVLKEKERIEEERLAELRKARRKEQMEALRGKVTDILFKKKPKIKKDISEIVRKEIRREIKLREKEKQVREVEKPKEKAKIEEKKEEPKVKEQKEKEVKEEHEPKKSFFSNFIQIKTAAEIAKEEEERLRREEEEALKDQSKVNQLFQDEGVDVKTNVLSEEQEVNLSTLFLGDNVKEEKQERQNNGDTIELDQGYKIKVIKNQ